MGIPPQVLSDYRNAFAEFANKARQAGAVMTATNPDWQAIDAALLDLEKARLNYNQHRNILAQQLGAQAPSPVEPHANRVSEIAELRWQLAGKPKDTDDENWYRAEDIVRRATAA